MMYATHVNRTALALRILLIFALAATFLCPGGVDPASAQDEGIFINVNFKNRTISSGHWGVGIPVTLTIDDPTTAHLDYSDATQTGDIDGFVWYEPNFDFTVSGTVVTASDGATTKRLVIRYFEITNVAYSSSFVSGTIVMDPEIETPSAITVVLTTAAGESYTQNATITDGNWQVDFLSLLPNGGSPSEWWNSLIIAKITDNYGNTISERWPVKPWIIAQRFINFSPWPINKVLCRGWELGKTITLTIDNPPQTLTTTVIYDPTHNTLSRADFRVPGATDLTGKVLTVSDGFFTHSMTVAPLTLDFPIDAANDQLSGTAPSNSQIDVSVDQMPDGFPSDEMWVTSTNDGKWSANFNYDINDLTEGQVNYYPDPESKDQRRIIFKVVPELIAGTVSAADGGEVALDDGRAVIEVPPGALMQDTVLTIAPQGTDLQVSTDLGLAQPAVNVNIGPNGTHFAHPATITLAWLDENNDGIVDGVGLNEADLYMFQDGHKIAGPCSTDTTHCNMDANTFTVEVTGLSEFMVGGLVQTSISQITGPLAPIQVGTAAMVSASVANAPGGDYTAIFAWGDNTFSTISASGAEISFNHTYAIPGVYSIGLTIAKDEADLASATYNYVVVYDSDGGFVTGGGWFWSQAGAYLADPGLTGKATFGFVSKYKKGASVPDGNTEFQFKAGGLNFHSENYEWLVVNNNSSRAQYKGQGTINGGLAPNGTFFKFMIWATDGNLDTFRIKIWWENSAGEQIVYDNGVEQAIGSGSIVVHTK